MKTTKGHLLNNPMSIFRIDPFSHYKFTIRFTQREYDLLGIKDPNCVYIIKDNDRVYMGEQLVRSQSVFEENHYLSKDRKTGEYIISMFSGNNGIELKRFTKQSHAVEYLELLGSFNDLDEMSMAIFEDIKRYQYKEIGVYDLIFCMILQFSHIKTDADFSSSLVFIDNFKLSKTSDVLDILDVEEIERSHQYRKELLVFSFIATYRLIETYNFFKSPFNIKIFIKKLTTLVS